MCTATADSPGGCRSGHRRCAPGGAGSVRYPSERRPAHDRRGEAAALRLADAIEGGRSGRNARRGARRSRPPPAPRPHRSRRHRPAVGSAPHEAAACLALTRPTAVRFGITPPGATMTSCRGRTTSTSTTSSPASRSVPSTLATSRGSKQTAGKRLYCHPNTVRHRLHRIERQTGRLLNDPRSSAELLVALEALRTLPGPAAAPDADRTRRKRSAGDVARHTAHMTP